MFETNPIKPDQVNAAKRVIYTVARELFHDQEPLEELIGICEARGELADIDDISRNYFENGGAFLVMTVVGRVIGSDSIR